MKLKTKIIFISIDLGIITGFSDLLIDHFAYKPDTLIRCLFSFDLHAIIVRLASLAICVGAGMIIARLVSDKKKCKEKFKKLFDLIPICSNCKSIRIDDNYYQTIEAFLKEHSGLECSHTLCDECMRKLYPEYAEKILAEKDKDNIVEDRR